MSRHRALYGSRWRKRRAAQLAAHPTCRLCEDLHGRVTAATVADHLVPHRGDPVLFEGPLQSLCATCHSSVKQQLEASGRFRGCDADGHPLDPAHPWNPGGARSGSTGVETVDRPRSNACSKFSRESGG